MCKRSRSIIRQFGSDMCNYHAKIKEIQIAFLLLGALAKRNF